MCEWPYLIFSNSLSNHAESLWSPPYPTPVAFGAEAKGPPGAAYPVSKDGNLLTMYFSRLFLPLPPPPLRMIPCLLTSIEVDEDEDFRLIICSRDGAKDARNLLCKVFSYTPVSDGSWGSIWV